MSAVALVALRGLKLVKSHGVTLKLANIPLNVKGH